MINNRTTDLESNVSYVEFDIPKNEIPYEYFEILPNVDYKQNENRRFCGKSFLKFLDYVFFTN
jgi:hypothetical protein